MKKLALVLAFLLIVSAPVTAATRSTIITPKLTFSETTAQCTVSVIGNSTSEFIEVTMKLMYGPSCVDSWTGSGYGFVRIQESATAISGRTYELVVEVTVNGVAKEPISTTKTC